MHERGENTAELSPTSVFQQEGGAASWTDRLLYVFPPLCLTSSLLDQVRQEQLMVNFRLPLSGTYNDTWVSCPVLDNPLVLGHSVTGGRSNRFDVQTGHTLQGLAPERGQDNMGWTCTSCTVHSAGK